MSGTRVVFVQLESSEETPPEEDEEVVAPKEHMTV